MAINTIVSFSLHQSPTLAYVLIIAPFDCPENKLSEVSLLKTIRLTDDGAGT